MKVRQNLVAERLGVRTTQEQLAAIDSLERMAIAPVIDIVIRFDPRTGQISMSIIGGDVPMQIAKQIIRTAEQQLHEQELKAALSVPKAAEVIPPQEQ